MTNTTQHITREGEANANYRRGYQTRSASKLANESERAARQEQIDFEWFCKMNPGRDF